jgi:hypothetical protein
LRVTQNPPVFNTANRPDRVLGQPVLVTNPGFDQYFNPAAFAISPKVPDFRGNAIQTFGNAGRSILRGPGSRNLDLSMFKEIRTTDEPRFNSGPKRSTSAIRPRFCCPPPSPPRSR